MTIFGMHVLDVIVVVWVLAVVFGVAFAFRSRASQSFDDFFLSGRRLSWWMLGTSMVATTFAADTPLAITGLVHSHGIAGNWLWWSLLFGATATVWFFSDNWRRARITSDIELCAVRYGGFAGSVLRGFRAGYMSFIYVGIILGWVFEAMATVLRVSLDLPAEMQQTVLLVLAALALAYTLLSGLWGVVATDFLQFVLAMGGSIVLAIFAWSDFGGATGLQERLVGRFGAEGADKLLSFFPTDLESFAGLGLGWMVWVLAVQWWAVVYPGSEPGGGSFVVQRMLAARSVRDARRGTMLYVVAHYAMRPWPWIIVALWTVVALDVGGAGQLTVNEAYPAAMKQLLPAGLFGLLLASFFAAFMSTVDTLLTLAGSYLINDLYRPFVARKRSEKHYLAASRVAIVLVLLAGLFVSDRLGETKSGIADAWRILLALGAGSGLVLALRWYWWRISAWSEIVAMIAAFGAAFTFDPALRQLLGSPEWMPESWLILATGDDPAGDSASRMFAIVGVATAVWLTATFLAPRTRSDRLDAFYRRVRPSGLWAPVAARCPDVVVEPRLGAAMMSWIFSTLLVLSCLFAIGTALFHEPWAWIGWAGLACFCALVLWGNERPREDDDEDDDEADDTDGGGAPEPSLSESIL